MPNFQFRAAMSVIALSALVLMSGCSKKLTRTKATKTLEQSAAFQQQKIIRFPVNVTLSGAELLSAYPVLSKEYLLLNNTNVASLQALGGNQYRFTLGPMGQSRAKMIEPNVYELTYGKRQLLDVTGIAPSGEDRADVEFSWQWQPILIDQPKSTWEQGFNSAVTGWLKDAHEAGTGKLIGGIRKTTNRIPPLR